MRALIRQTRSKSAALRWRLRSGVSHAAWALCLSVSLGALLDLAGCAAVHHNGCLDATCRSDERCIEDLDGQASCQPRCILSIRCPDTAPICDEQQAACRSCHDGDDARCRERSAQTPRCIAGQCVACIAKRGVTSESDDCTTRGREGPSPLSSSVSATPICDQGSCRACVHHSECDSGVCAKDDSGAPSGIYKGQCVPFEQVLVVDQNLCSRSGPVYCTPQQAIDRLSSNQRYVLLRKVALASDFSGIDLSLFPTGDEQVFHIIGPLADGPPQRAASQPGVTLGGIAGGDGLRVRSGQLVLEGLFVRGNRVGIRCQGASTFLRIERSLFVENETAVLAESGCQLALRDSWLGRAPTQSLFAGLSANARSVEINGADFQIENSIFADNGDYSHDAFGGVRVRALSTGGTRVSSIANTTFMQQSGLSRAGRYYTALWCDKPVSDRIVVLNALFASDRPLVMTPEEHYLDAGCGAAVFGAASNDSALSKSGVFYSDAVRDSLFIDRARRDLRLLRGTLPEQKAIAQGGMKRVRLGDVTVQAPDQDQDEQPRGMDAVAIGAFEPTTIAPR